ncbi:sigma 54-interacting transcriptional regulator [Candidatus Thalassolituus haligoni]|uniref:sigma 54-interacting transcriptional regulator n=1 Tax=Candidatus Thalassolituus haligoni TaxID=3100113 RepID=UPI003516FFFA
MSAHNQHQTLHPIREFIDDQALAEKLRFAPDSGLIQLFENRMLLVHGFSLAALRRELIERLGLDKTREMFTRLGYQQGVADARSLIESEGGQTDTKLAMLPRLRELQGFVRNQAVDRMHFNEQTGDFWGDYYWQSSWEADAHLQHYSISGIPACWMMTGYACGATTTIMGRPILWREVECVAMGHARCRVVGQPLDECDDSAEHLKFLQIEDFVAAPGRRPPPRQDKGFQLADISSLPDLVGASASFNAAVHLLKRVAPTDATVLLKGESGVGKERFSKTLHAIGPRADKPMISVNCAAIPADLVEAELFGVEKGAFTGATVSRPGRFERADGGTLFLDEIASLPLHAQGKLLRVLQEGEVERVGDIRVRAVDVRIVAAANRNLRDEVKAGRFREDLFYRLNVFPIEIPPLRERREDLPLMVSVFVKRYSQRFNKVIKGITQRASEALWAYEWPGNVRELENIIERAVILADNDANIDLHHLFSGDEDNLEILFKLGPDGELTRSGRGEPSAAADIRVTEHPLPSVGGGSRDGLIASFLDTFGSLETMETSVLDYALAQSGGNLSAAARLLKMTRAQFEYRLKKYRQLQRSH